MWSPTLRPDDKTDDMEEIIGDAHIQNGFDPPCTKPGPFGYELCGVCKSPGWRAWLFVGSGRAAHAESMAARFLFAVGVGLASVNCACLWWLVSLGWCVRSDIVVGEWVVCAGVGWGWVG